MVRLSNSERTRTRKQYRIFIVRPEDPKFNPNDWRARPARYRILSDEGVRTFKGQSDAFRFTHNHDALAKGQFDRWAIAIDCEN